MVTLRSAGRKLNLLKRRAALPISYGEFIRRVVQYREEHDPSELDRAAMSLDDDTLVNEYLKTNGRWRTERDFAVMREFIIRFCAPRYGYHFEDANECLKVLLFGDDNDNNQRKNNT